MIAATLYALGCAGFGMICVPHWLGDPDEDKPTPLGFLLLLACWPAVVLIALGWISASALSGRRP